jgi:ABC-2 type transport system ATP-binding protein
MLQAVEVKDLVFLYGERAALKGVGFSVAQGEVFGLLGPNGGGKTTLFRILATLLEPASGSAAIFGRDVVAARSEVRKQIGVVFQAQSLDRRLTAVENLTHQGHLYGLRGSELTRRIRLVLEQVGLSARSGEVVEMLSGGLRRRVELAKALLHRPQALLLDEPSTGVDPKARLDFWDCLQTLRREDGVTILLTTHLLEEADKCDRLAILDEGSIVVSGSPANLKRDVGGEVVVLSSPDPEELAARLAGFDIKPQIVERAVRFELGDAIGVIPSLMASLPQHIDSVTISRPTLEDVFIQRTGHRLDGQNATEAG